VVIGIDNAGESRVQTFISDSTGESGLDARRFDELADCLASAGFRLHNGSANRDAASQAVPMEIVGGTERDTIPGVVSAKGIVVLMALVFVALAIAVGLSKHLEATPRRGGSTESFASAATSTSTLHAEDSTLDAQDGVSTGGASASGGSRLSRAGNELRRLGSNVQGSGGSRGYSQISPGGLSGSDSDTGAEGATKATLISSDDEEPRTPPLKDRDRTSESGPRLSEPVLEPQPGPGPESRGQLEAEVESESETGSLGPAVRP
jgi:hypothetical protein